MSLRVIGLSHLTAPVEVRETVAFTTGNSLPHGLAFLKTAIPDCESVLLSTCNRTELYLTNADHLTSGELVDLLLRARGLENGSRANRDNYLTYFDERRGHRAIEHLFRVTAGLESMVLGEADIVRQVKDAYAAASDAGTVGSTLNPLFHESLRVAKRARTETDLSRGSFGIGHAAAEVAQTIFGDLTGRTVLLLGAGTMSETTARHLASLGVATIIVANRTFDRAAALAELLNGRAIHYDAFPEQLTNADIVIASTAAPHCVVDKAMVQTAMRKRRNRPLYLIDIAVPRDIDAEAGNVENVFLYNIDHFQAAVDADSAARRSRAAQAEKIVREEATVFAEKMRVTQTAAPLVSEIRSKLEDVSNEELLRLRKRLPHLKSDDWLAIEAFARSLQNKIAHTPSIKIKEYAHDDQSAKIETARELFGLTAPSEDEH